MTDPKKVGVQHPCIRWEARTAIDQEDLKHCSPEVTAILTRTPTEETGYKAPPRKE